MHRKWNTEAFYLFGGWRLVKRYTFNMEFRRSLEEKFQKSAVRGLRRVNLRVSVYYHMSGTADNRCALQGCSNMKAIVDPLRS